MNSRALKLTNAVGLFLLCGCTIGSFASEAPYRLAKTIPVGGAGGGWDYMSIDQVNRRLYVTHANSVAVIDIDKDVAVGLITNTPGVHDLAPIPELQRGFASLGRENKAAVIDLKTLEILSKVETGPSPQCVLYEPGKGEIYVFSGRAPSATLIDPKASKTLAQIALDGLPASGAVDTAAGRVFVSLKDKGLLAVVDTQARQVVSRWPVATGEFPSGLAIDAAHHRLFIGCHNKLLVMMNSTNGNVLASLPIGARVDTVAFDPETQLVFASGGDGTLTVAHEDSPDKLSIVQTLPTERGARTMAWDSKTHRVFVATAKFAAPPEAAPGAPRQGPHLLPETFGVLVFELQP